MQTQITPFTAEAGANVAFDVDAVTQRFTVTAYSDRMQRTGQLLLRAGLADLFEVEEDVFSTCQDPIYSLAERLIRARDLRIPLVEVAVFPKDFEGTDLVRQTFELNGDVVRALVDSNGLELTEPETGAKIIGFTTMSASLPAIHPDSLGIKRGSPIITRIDDDEIRYRVDDRGRVTGNSDKAYEVWGSAQLELGTPPPRFAENADQFLAHILRDFAIATSQERAGAIHLAAEVPQTPSPNPQLW